MALISYRRFVAATVCRARVLVALMLMLPTQAVLAQEEFLPKNDKGPIVIVISGQTGPANYRSYAQQVADLGYYTVLIDGNEVLTKRWNDGLANLQTTIAKAQESPRAVPGKVALVAFSRGGGGVLAHGVDMTDKVSAIVLYYPATSWSKNLEGIASRIRIPTLLLAAEQDTYNNCCLIGSMRELETAAKARQAPLELVVYPSAGHGFNLRGRGFRGDDATDAWRRAAEMLSRLHPVKQ